MTNLFKTRYLPNADGTESTTALTNANTVFIHTYLGDDSTGDGTREKPYKSMTKALLKGGITYVIFRGVINEAFNSASRVIVGDDINQLIVTSNYTQSISTIYNVTFDNPGIASSYPTKYRTVCNNNGTAINWSHSFALFIKGVTLAGNSGAHIYITSLSTYVTAAFYPSITNSISINTHSILNGSNIVHKYLLLLSNTVLKVGSVNAIQPNWTNISKNNISLLRASYMSGGISSGTLVTAFPLDSFGNETCLVVKELRAGGNHVPVFNKYDIDRTGKLQAAITTGAKTSIRLITDVEFPASSWPTTGDIFLPTETAYTNNSVTMPIGSFEVWTYTSVTINGANDITLTGPSYTFKTAHNSLTKTCTRYGDVLDFTLNPDPTNEALWASDTGGYVGFFRPAYACNVETGLSTISNVDENGTNSGSGDLLQIVNGELKFNSASSQLWNRMSDTTTINIPNGSNFKGLNAMSQDGSPFGYYIGKKQTLISPTAIAAGNALTVGKWYKVYNDNGNSVSEAIIYNGVQYLPEYTFLCVTGVTTFSTLEPGSGSYVKEILSGVLESIEILPYNDMITPSTFPKFSAPLMGECKLIFYTASGAARYGKTAGDPVKFADLDLANMITDFGNVKNKISYYDTWAISNADSEFYLLTNAGLSTTLKGYFTQSIPAIKYLRREINGHFDMPYDY